MQQWEDTGIIMTVGRYGEQSAIVRVLTAEHGLFPGMVKGAQAKKNRGIYQPGNRIHLHWQARLEEHLGQMRCELVDACTAELLSNPLALKLMNAVGAMVISCIPERIPENDIYLNINYLLYKLKSSDDNISEVLYAYVVLEFTLLQALGFGLDLSCCAGTGETNTKELIYVSPKSGKAVSREAGEPYKDKLLPLPAFLLGDEAQKTAPDMRQMLDGLALAGYFLDAWVLQPEGKHLPDARQDFISYLRKKKPEAMHE